MVVDDSGAAVPGAVVTFGRSASVLAAAMADMDGRFHAAVPATGAAFTVSAFSDEHDGGTQDLALGLDQVAAVLLTLPATVDDVDAGTQAIRDIARAAAWHYGH
jgi:hypothetical protein